jgi:hypothetical protein
VETPLASEEGHPTRDLTFEFVLARGSYATTVLGALLALREPPRFRPDVASTDVPPDAEIARPKTEHEAPEDDSPDDADS